MAQKSKWSRHSERASLHRLGERVRTARRERGLTQEDLAGALGISVAYMSLIERGGRNPPFTTVVAIATALGVHAGELCSE